MAKNDIRTSEDDIALKAQTTIPRLIQEKYAQYGDKKVWMRRKDLGIWQTYTWRDCYEEIKYLSFGLASLGMAHGDKVAVVGDNDPEYYWAEYAAMARGGIFVGIYTDALPAEIQYIVEHSDAKFVFARDQEQVDKLLAIMKQGGIPLIKGLIYWDAKGLWNYDEPMLFSIEDAIEKGRQYERDHPGSFERHVDKVKPSDTAFCIYTSGTTGLPKGVLVTHQAFILGCLQWQKVVPWRPEYNFLSYMSPAWMTEQWMGLGAVLLAGAIVNFIEEPDTLDNDIREVGPEIIFYGSRLWENIASRIQAKINDTTPLKRFTYKLAMPIAYRMADYRLNNQRPNFVWWFLYQFTYWLMLRPLLDKFGLVKTKIAWTAGSFLSPDSFRFIHVLNIPLRQIFGSTESALLAVHKDKIRPETLGERPEGVEVAIGPNNEILGKNPAMFSGYYKDSEATAKAIDSDGWYHTGDAGFFDDDGQLIYLDRVKELLELSDGSKFSPQYIESSLRFSPNIKDCIALGGKGRPYVTVLVDIDFSNVGRWAEENHISYTNFTTLTQKLEVCGLIEKDIQRVNKVLPEHAVIKKFALFYKEIDPDEAELTRTRKLKRDFIEKKYARLISAFYDDLDEVKEKSEITYQNGRKTIMEVIVRIRPVKEIE